ncbi:MAG: hypothetical protein Q9170_000477 [Blastenia crenularia]
MNCQKCRAPLKLDSSLQDFNSPAFDLLTGSRRNSVEPTISTSRTPFPQERRELHEQSSKDVSSPTFKRVVPPARHGVGSQPAMAASTKAGLKDNPAMSFVMLTDSQVVPAQAITNRYENPRSKANPSKSTTMSSESPDPDPPTLSQQIQSTTRLFEILSARSDIDHPVCTECTDLLLSQLQSRLSSATKERDAYISYLKSLNTSAPTPSQLQKAQKSLTEARAAEAKAFADLEALEKEKANLDSELTALEAESLALDAEEQEFWRSRNAFALTLSEFQNERDALNAAYDHDAQQLERLERTNVYNDCFCISHDGNFVTINGLRLGRLPPPHNVEWAEINAALGTAALLLTIVAEKMGFEFKGYRIKPMGSTSHIEKFEWQQPISASTAPSSQSSSTATITPAPTAPPSPTHQQQQKSTILDLFSSGDLPLGAGRFLHRRLDAGMVAFIDCIRQLGEFVEECAACSESPNPASPRSTESRNVRQGIVKLPYTIKKDKIGDVSVKLAFLLAHASNVVGKRS